MSAQPGQLPVLPTQQQLVAPAGASDTPLLDAMIARGLVSAKQENPQATESATPLEGYPQLPNPDPNSAPPLYGEPPGFGYLYAPDPETRHQSLVRTTPDFVREQILRAMEVIAYNVTLPFNEEGADKNADALLKMAQAYLLIDPSVDADGVPVAGKAMAQAGAQIAVQAGKPGAGPSDGSSSASQSSSSSSSSSSGAHGSVSKGPTVGDHAEPARVLAGQAAQILQEMHANAETVLKGARASRPLPRPRPSS
jgi:hypothetical protein